MSYLKMWGLLFAVAALLGFAAGPASATTLTNGSGSHPTEIQLKSTHLNWHNGFVNITCMESEAAAAVSTGGAGLTVEGPLSSLNYKECGSWNVTVLHPGSLIVHSTGNNNATITWVGGELTREGFGLHCVVGSTLSATDIGMLTGSANTGGHAILDIAGTIARIGGRSGAFCGSTEQWTGTYTVTQPAVLNVDS